MTAPTPPDDGLRAAVEALTDEWEGWDWPVNVTRPLRDALAAHPAPTPENRCQEFPDIVLHGMRCEMSGGLHTHYPAPTPVAGEGDGLADLIAGELHEHYLATGVGEGIPGDGEWAWIRCICGYGENVETPTDDIRDAEKVWDEHLAAHVADAIRAAGWSR